MAQPEEYKNIERGRITTLFDADSSTGHLYEDTYVTFKKSMLSLLAGDQKSIRNLMRRSMKSDEAIEPVNAEEKQLFEIAGKAGIYINDKTQHRILKEWSKANFSAKHQPEWLIDISGEPMVAENYENMQKKVAGLSPDSPIPDFINATSSYNQHDFRSQTLLNREGINGLNYSVARVALDS